MRLFVIAILLSSSSVAYKNLDWKILEKYMIKISSSPRNYGIDSNHIPVLYEHDISHDHDKSSTRKMGFFTTMFPGSSQPHLNYTDEDEGTPLFLTPLLEQGKIDIARDLARVRNLSDIESYSGFLTVNKKYDSNLFFWYVPSKLNQNAPLILWLQGGPGGSSLFGLFIEHGPFYVTDQLELMPRSTAWSLPYNVLYIDQPVGTGFSFTKNDRGYATNQEMVANDLYEAMKQFYALFPSLLQQDLYVTGESYAGKYVPAISYKIHAMNAKGQIMMPLKGLAIGDGLCDPPNQLDYADFLYQVGLLDEADRDLVSERTDMAKMAMESQQWHKATDEFDSILSLVMNKTGLDFYYNYLLSKQPPDFANYPKFLQKAQVRKAIHVGNLTYEDVSEAVHDHLSDDMLKTIKPWLETLLEAGYKVMIYNGQLDVIIAFPQTENFLNQLDWSGKYLYGMAPRKIWKVENDVAGYVREAKNLKQIMVRNAGHILPYDQPKWAFDMIQRFVQDKAFA